eukprot:TRINITY_DN32218_c0_g1_i2.p1 TRINITY_DN32218_c0_g1~~TRINITY_DN32218_c0_g1_i2.p1  ORF type:complete len:291 (-),score=47.96 TRINITY_DN32218_c0_g1_i2:149-1021(-)
MQIINNRFLTVPKTPQRARSAAASRSCPRKGSRKASRKQSQSSADLAKILALDALLESKWKDGISSVSDILRSILNGCLLSPSGWRLFSEELVARLLPKVLHDKRDAEAAEHDLATSVAIVMRVLHQAADMLGSSFSDVAGQVLWRNRRASVLQNATHKAVVEDLSWAFCRSSSFAGNDVEVSDLSEDIHDYFSGLTSGRKGCMTHREWQQVVALLIKNPILKSRIKASEVEHIYFADERKSTRSSGGIRFKVFKKLLLQLAESIHVHPWIVVFALGAHARQTLSRPSTA